MRLYELMQHKITVISGHFGSGKTNVALNLALDAADAGEQVSIADLDIVNPYFRTADSEAFLRARGIKPLVPQYANTNVEIPTLPEALGEIFYGGRRAVVDVGGDRRARRRSAATATVTRKRGTICISYAAFTGRPRCAQRTR